MGRSLGVGYRTRQGEADLCPRKHEFVMVCRFVDCIIIAYMLVCAGCRWLLCLLSQTMLLVAEMLEP